MKQCVLCNSAINGEYCFIMRPEPETLDRIGQIMYTNASIQFAHVGCAATAGYTKSEPNITILKLPDEAYAPRKI